MSMAYPTGCPCCGRDYYVCRTEKIREENKILRQIISDIVTALESGAVAPTASVEFMGGVPKEVGLVVRGFKLQIAKLQNDLKISEMFEGVKEESDPARIIQ